MLTVICGPTGSNKRAVVKELCNEYGFIYIPTLTTRPKRTGDKDDDLHNFLTDDEFDDLLRNGNIVEHTSLIANNGEVYKYGTSYYSIIEIIMAQNSHFIMILNPSAIRTIAIKYRHIITNLIRLCAHKETVIKRCLERGDDNEEEIGNRWNDELDELNDLIDLGFVSEDIRTDDRKIEDITKEITDYVYREE